MVQLAYCKIWLHLIGQVLVLVTSDWSVLVLVKQPEKCLTVASPAVEYVAQSPSRVEALRKGWKLKTRVFDEGKSSTGKS